MRATHIAVDANVRAASEDDAMPAHGVVVSITLEVMSKKERLWRRRAK
jgi:hypothetical protein